MNPRFGGGFLLPMGNVLLLLIMTKSEHKRTPSNASAKAIPGSSTIPENSVAMYYDNDIEQTGHCRITTCHHE